MAPEKLKIFWEEKQQRSAVTVYASKLFKAEFVATSVCLFHHSGKFIHCFINKNALALRQGVFGGATQI